MLLGEMLVHFGVVEPEAVAAAMAEKQRSEKRLGEILVQQGATTAEEIQRALAFQTRVRGSERVAPAAFSAQKRAAVPGPSAALPSTERSAPRLRMTSSLLLGEILFMQGTVSREDLAQGLAEQRRSGRMLGEILLELGLVTRRQLEHALSFQGNTRRRSSARRAA
jgi:adenylate cyclase